MGAAQDGSSRVSSSRRSLHKTPASGTSVVRDQVQNSPRPQPFHAHQQPDNIPIAMNAAEERARSSCNRRIPRTACMCCGTTRHAQISATIPAPKARPLTTAARGDIRRAVASTKPQARLRRLIANNGGGCRAAKASWKSRGNASRNCRETSPRSLPAFRKTKGKSAPATSRELVYDKALRQDSHATKRTAIRREISGTMIRSAVWTR